MADALEVHVTLPNTDAARALGRTLVEERLAACVNIVPGVVSIYRWEGTIHEDGEVLCLVKTSPDCFERLRARVLELHPYEVPEVLALAVDDGSRDYLDWLHRNTRPAAD
ncbi:MAG: divalent-cation tolerance protein CutA [Verrucomicrobiota bacterium]